MSSELEKQLERLSASRVRTGTLRSLVRDLPVIFAGLALFYGLLSLARYWSGPVRNVAEIHLSPGRLPEYALFSVARIAIAYGISFVITLIYAYIAAHNAKAERVMIPLLDTLQSIPVLSFLPGVMLSMIALFPTRQLGLELGSILLIVTGQVWNMIFSVYSSIKSIPAEMLEAARLYRLSRWQQFVQLEMPFSTIGLVWNSIMSVAGAWFFLMACEMFVLGNRDLRLPGLGSYLQTAANAGDLSSILWGLAVMIAVIVLTDLMVWRPVIAWAEKFKFEQVEASAVPRSPVLDFLRRSAILGRITGALVRPVDEALIVHFAHASKPEPTRGSRVRYQQWLGRVILAFAIAGLCYGVTRMALSLLAISRTDLAQILEGALATFLRVELTLFLAALWTVPVGIYIGLHPRLAAIAQPFAQIAASVPATALFPIVLLLLIQAGGGLGVGSIALLLLGTQWYVLFNVIAGASAIPADLKEVSSVFRLGTLQRWKDLFLPAIFPYLITGLITASGGAWNASIVAEYVHFRGRTMSTTGLGAVISHATDTGNLPLLLGATVVMAIVVVTINRLVWRRLYALAATKFRLG